MASSQTTTEHAASGKTLKGTVVGVSAKDTIRVLVTRYFKHPRYGKFIKRHKTYLAHDPGNTRAVGDEVTIKASRPISKRKHFIVVGS